MSESFQIQSRHDACAFYLAHSKSYMDANVLVPTLLFILLSPGLILTFPPGAYMTGKTSTAAVFAHAVVFALAYYLLRKWFPQYY